MSIVQKVSWDDTFPLDGGGHVHMQLQFILSEEEQNRIRSVREAAMKKKLSSIPNISPTYSENSSQLGDSVISSPKPEQIISDSQTRNMLRVVSFEDVSIQASSLSNRDNFNEVSLSNYGTVEGLDHKQEIPKAVEESEGVSSAPGVHGIGVHFSEVHESEHSLEPEIQSSVHNLEHTVSDFAEKNNVVSVYAEQARGNRSEHQPPLKKSPSSVRKLVSAFENSLAQEVKSPVEVSTMKLEPKKFGKGSRQKDHDPKDVSESAQQRSGRLENPFITVASKAASRSGENNGSNKSSGGNSSFETINELKQSTSIPIESRKAELSSREWANTPGDSDKTSTAETEIISGRKMDEHSSIVSSVSLPAEKTDISSSSYAEGDINKDSIEINIQIAPSGKSQSIEHREEPFHFEKSDMWIFPNDREHLCITTAGKRVMNLLGKFDAEAGSHHKQKSSSLPEDSEKLGTENKKDHNNSSDPRKSKPERSSNDASGGLVAQVIKIAVIVGFGVLVFITRQREPRKPKRDTNDLFTARGFLDEQLLTESEDGQPTES